MRRAPRVIVPEDRHDSSLVSDLLSSVYSTVVPASLRGMAGSNELQVDVPRHCEVTSCDVLDNRIAFSYASAGFSVWYISSPSAKATELMCETEGSPIRLVRLVPKLLPDPTPSPKGKNGSAAKELSPSSSVVYEDAWGDISLTGGKPAGLESPDLLYVEIAQDHVVKAVSLQSGRLVDVLGFEAAVSDVRASGRFVGVMLRDHSARVYVRNDACKLSDSTRIVSLSHAHPLVLGPRWAAYGANAGFEARHGDELAHGQEQQQLPSVWQDLTKQLAASAFKLGEAGSKRLADYLNHSNGGPSGGGGGAGDSQSSEDSACACDVILVRDLLADRPVCRIQSESSFLHFDESGALLVTAVRDGQSVHVYSLPRGTLLYKLERGLRPARIVSAGFSPDRRWLAVASSRGTTHVFAVDPSGARPTMLSHGSVQSAATTTPNQFLGAWLSSAVASSSAPASPLMNSSSPKLEPRYMREQTALGQETHVSGSLGKVTSSHVPPRLVVFSASGELRIVSGNGLVEDFTLRAVREEVGGGEGLGEGRQKQQRGSQGLSAVEVLPMWSLGLMRDVKESVMPATPFTNGTLASGGGKGANGTVKSTESLSDMLSFDVSVSNFEPQPFLEPLVPVWASPQLILVQTAPNSKADASSLFYAPQGTVLQVRSATPPPGLADAMRTPAFPGVASSSPPQSSS